ncbi:hypothetical protein CCAL13119_08275 [Campylobacter sp. RM13119]|uniref:hypothetical protein n=1 Tax=Campylobacter californiensis TaxID=1032243 RepID=UPI001472FE77|nr:hypothetical protein [Campylobacter sp. RM13119]MBE3606925.1 hypothetical protein [Campylobacter sp. RM13119]
MQLLEAMQKRKSVREFNRYVPTKEEIEAVIGRVFVADTIYDKRCSHKRHH